MKTFKYIILLFLITACSNHPPMLYAINEMAKIEEQIPQLCEKEIQLMVYPASNEGAATCRMDKLLQKAKDINWAEPEKLELLLKERISWARKYDSHQISEPQYIYELGKIECKYAKNLMLRFKKYNRDLNLHEIDKKAYSDCIRNLNSNFTPF